ncbi:hypothetical protein GOODEAATRI_031274, partial [Goodea atripinnis]
TGPPPPSWVQDNRPVEGLQHTAPKSNKGQMDLAQERRSSPRAAIRPAIIHKESLATVLTKTINQSIKDSIFTAALNKSIVTPIFKSGDKQHISNYWPNTILPISNLRNLWE